MKKIILIGFIFSEEVEAQGKHDYDLTIGNSAAIRRTVINSFTWPP